MIGKKIGVDVWLPTQIVSNAPEGGVDYKTKKAVKP
jgi:hypothetical protein